MKHPRQKQSEHTRKLLDDCRFFLASLDAPMSERVARAKKVVSNFQGNN